MPYDPCWQQRWASYDKITGDTLTKRRTVIRPVKRKPLELGFWRWIGDNEDFYATLELLGCSVPEPLRFSGSIQQSIRAEEPTVGAEQVYKQRLRDAKDWDNIAVRQRQACAEDPTDMEAHLRLAKALRWIGQVDEAANVLLGLTHGCDQLAVPAQLQLLPLVCDTLEKAERRFEAIEFRRRLAQLAPESKPCGS